MNEQPTSNPQNAPKRRWVRGIVAMLIVSVAAVTYAENYWPDWRDQAGDQFAKLRTWVDSLRSDTPESATSELVVHEMDENLTTVEYLTVEAHATSSLPRHYTGVLRATRSSGIGFKTTGRVMQVMVEEGDLVNEGEVIAELDANLIQAEIQVVTAQRAAAQALLDELIAGPRRQTIAAAKADVESSEARVEQARITFERLERLVQSDSVARQEFDDARKNLEALEKLNEAKLEALNELEEGTRAERIAAQRAQVEVLEAQLNSLEVRLDETKLLAPFDALVSTRFIDEGSVVSPSEPVLRLVEDLPPEAWIGLPAEVAIDLKLQDLFEISIGQREFLGRIKAILPELDNKTRTQSVVFEISESLDPNSPRTIDLQEFAIGQLAQLKLTQEVSQEGYWLPIKALSRGTNGLWSALKLAELGDSFATTCTVKRTDLEVVQVDSDRVLVRGLINSGDRIVASGVHKLTSGQRVRISHPATESSDNDLAELTLPGRPNWTEDSATED